MTLYTSGDWKVDPNKDVTFPLVDWIVKLFPVIKDKEIERLTQAALKRPNDYSVWWATGGVVLGVLSTVLVVSATK